MVWLVGALEPLLPTLMESDRQTVAGHPGVMPMMSWLVTLVVVLRD